MDQSLSKLTKAEEEVMQYIWDYGPATVSQLIEKMEDPKPPAFHHFFNNPHPWIKKALWLTKRMVERMSTMLQWTKAYTRFSLKNWLAIILRDRWMNWSHFGSWNDLSLPKIWKKKKNKFKSWVPFCYNLHLSGQALFTLLQPIEADNFFLHSIAGTYHLRCSWFDGNHALSGFYPIGPMLRQESWFMVSYLKLILAVKLLKGLMIIQVGGGFYYTGLLFLLRFFYGLYRL